MFQVLEEILFKSELSNLFLLKVKDDMSKGSNNIHIAYRVKPNIYKIRAFELLGDKKQFCFRVYHSNKINDKLKDKLIQCDKVINNKSYVIDYESNDYIGLATKIKNLLLSNEIINECKSGGIRAKTSKFEGLDLPDIDTTQDNILGQIFTWKDIISIWEDNSEENNLKKMLSKNGIYIQRSEDGKSRYIGSAYGANGIIGRWMKHLNSNGDAQHLNLFVLENGYNKIVFSVIELYDGEDIIKRENMWKQILGTVNCGPYNGFQLNNN